MVLLDVHQRLFSTQGQERILRLQKKHSVSIIQKRYLNLVSNSNLLSKGMKNLIGISFRTSQFQSPMMKRTSFFGVSSFFRVSSFFNVSSDMQMIPL